MKMIDVGRMGAIKSTYVAPEMAIFHCEEVIRTSSSIPWNKTWSDGWEDHYENTNPIG